MSFNGNHSLSGTSINVWTEFSRSYLDLSKDEINHALFLHNESAIVDASLVGYMDYVVEDILVNDLLNGEITTSETTVCMQ